MLSSPQVTVCTVCNLYHVSAYMSVYTLSSIHQLSCVLFPLVGSPLLGSFTISSPGPQVSVRTSIPHVQRTHYLLPPPGQRTHYLLPPPGQRTHYLLPRSLCVQAYLLVSAVTISSQYIYMYLLTSGIQHPMFYTCVELLKIFVVNHEAI